MKENLISSLMVKIIYKCYSFVEGKRQQNGKYQIKNCTTNLSQNIASEMSHRGRNDYHQAASYRRLRSRENNGNSSTYYVLNNKSSIFVFQSVTLDN